MKFFLLDKQQNIIGRLSEEYILEATFTEEINTAGELLITLPAKKRLSGNVIHVLITNPSKDHSYLMFKIIKETVKDEEVEYTAVESAYDELTSYGYIQDKRPTANAQTITEMILKDTRWHVGEIPDTSEAFISFYYLSVLDCLKKIVQTFDFEIGFDVLINDDENQITDRRVNFYIKQGEQTGKRFEYGSNLLSIKQEQDTQNIYTALVGRGKGVQVSGGDDDNTPDGYGRRITFANVEWSKANGDPLDKPKGQEWLEDPDATKQLGFSDGHMRIGLEVFEDVDDPKTLLQKTYEALKTAERPQVQFSASVINTGELHLGDRVGITRNDIGIAYETRVFKVQHNLLDETQNKIDLGDNLEQTNNLSYQVSALQSEVTNNTEGIITVTQSANGKNKVYYSSTMPATGSNGDVWYKDLGNGETEMYIYDNGWQLVISTENLHKIEDEIKQQQSALDQAVQDANAASTKADSLVAQVGDANTNAQKALTTAQQNQADLAQAKNDLENTKNQLTNVQSDLTGTKSSLAGAISNISQAQEDLKNTKQSLQGVKSDLANTKQSLANDEKNLTSLSEQAQAQGQTIVDIQKTQSGLSADVADVKGNVSSLQDTADGLQATVGTLNSDNLLYNSDFMANTPGKAPNTDWLPVPGWLSLNNTAVQRCLWYNQSALQVGWINANGGFYTKAVKSNTPDPKNANATTAYDLSFLIMSDPGTYDVYIEASYTEDFSAPKQIKLGTINQCQNWTPQEYSFTVPNMYPWLRLKMVSEQNKGLFYLAQPMLVYGSKKPSSYISSNQPSQKIASISETVDGIKTAVTDNTNGISQIKQTAQSIQSNVANNKNDISSIKQTADSLKSSIQDDEKNISSLQQTAQGLQGSISDNKNDIANIKATAQGLQTSVQDNKKNISTIQQQAGTIESAISTVNSDNLIYNSDFLTTQPGISPLTNWKPADGWNSINTAVQRCMWYGYSALQVGWINANAGMYTRAIKASQPNTSDASAKTQYNLSFLIKTSAGTYDVYIDCSYDDTFNNSTAVKVDTITQAYSPWTKLNWTVELPSIYPWIRLRIISEQDKGLFYLAQPMLVYGSDTPSKYISSNQPGQKMSSIKQTIDSIQSTVQGNTGQISQVKQTADSLQSSITQGIGSYLPNGDFADSNVSKYWVPWDTTKDLSEVFVVPSSGTKDMPPACLKIQTKSSENKTDIGTKDYIPFNINEPIEIKAWSWLNASNGNTQFQFYIHCYDENHNEVDSGSGYFKYDNLNEWELTDVTFGKDQWNKSTVSMRLEIVLFGGGIDTAGYITGLKIINGSSGIASQFTQTIDSLTSKIADADGNISQLKQTSDSLTSQIGNANNDISSLKQRADSMESNISDNKNDISDLRQTANSLQSNIQSKADISQITQLSNAFQTVVQNIGPFYPDGDFSDADLGKYYDPWDTCPNLDNFSVVTNNKDWGYYLQIYTPHGTINKAITKEYLPINAQYSLTFKGKSLLSYGGKLNGSFMVYMHFFDSNKNAIQNQASYYKYDNNNVWQDFSLSFTPPSNAAYVRVETVLDNSKGDGVYWGALDNLSLDNGGSTIASKISQMSDDINLRVQKGDLLSQINIQAGSTLIQSKKLFLDASSVVFSGNAFIPSAAITDLSADKITTGTLNAGNVNIINLNVDKLVGNTTEFVRSGWTNAYGSHVQIDGGGMGVSYGNWYTRFDGNGMTFKDGGDNLGGFTRVGMTGAPSWYNGLAFNAGGDAEFLSIGAQDYGNDSQNPVPAKLLWMRNGINTYGYQPGWNFEDTVWADDIRLNHLGTASYRLDLVALKMNDETAFGLQSGNGYGFWWGANGGLGIYGGGKYVNFRNTQFINNFQPGEGGSATINTL